MPRPYIGLQIDGLEIEFERAREEGDFRALQSLLEELGRRRETPRSRRLRDMLFEASAAPKDNDGHAGQAASSSVRSDEEQRLTPGRRPTTKRQGRSPPSHKPTEEQEAAVDAFKKGGSVKINAYAGAGKTSTLQMLAHAATGAGQYLAFNKKIVFDSRGKFPTDVDCATTHSIAFRSLKGKYPTEQLIGKLTANQLVEVLSLKNWRVDRNHVLAARSQAYLILATIRRFCQSDKSALLEEHVPRHGSLAAASQETIQEVARMAHNGAQHIWDRMLAPSDPLPLGHDGYLKAWALSDPRLPADYIMLDEAQDTNPVVLGVLKNQSAQMVYVGDKFQQIYEWRGAVNAMDQVEAAHTVYLTTSFRFGGDIGQAANRVLAMLGAEKPLVGNPQRNSRIGSISNGTILARTNATTITACIEALDVAKRPHLVGGTDELIAMLRGVKDLKDGQQSSVPEFFGFENWQQVLEFVRSGEGEELLTFVNLVEARGEGQLLWALNRVVDEDECDIVISTAHKAKGREWPYVRLMDDFLKSLPKKEADGRRSSELEPSELRLLYVALTRAKEIMELPPALADFLATGRLPDTSQSEAATYTRSPLPRDRNSETNAGPRARADWSPPRNWQPTESRSGITPTSVSSSRSDAKEAAPSLNRPKKVSLLRRLLGGA